ncbi:hypothetical protein CERSUDRAFT_110435 [Gelatoporia subvermispora B]|uniref:RRM domain-containing protein n=1 Tax=Ceriporiopsis subvermispora (strain B) TaxID=914234 RepID=M2RTV1_CERS8|nr:hypothetical protein CERSUDRAFT_110435 [Gelatoporia subvermispora B]
MTDIISRNPASESLDTKAATDIKIPNMKRLAIPPLRRSSSHLRRWINDQSKIPSDEFIEPLHEERSLESSSSGCHPYLAYPHLSHPSLLKDASGTVSVESFVVIDDIILSDEERVLADTISTNTNKRATRPALRGLPEPSSSAVHQLPTRGYSPSPLRNIHLTFRARRTSVSSPDDPLRSPTTNPTSVPRAAGERQASHSRGSSLSTLFPLPRSNLAACSDPPCTPPRNTAWKLKRPSVMGHFSPGSVVESDVALPRPSLSSTVTRSSATSYSRTSTDSPSVTRKIHFGSIRSQSPSSFFNPSPSLWSLPTDASHMNDPPESTKVIARDSDMTRTIRSPLSLKSSNVSGLGSVASMLASPKSKRKRKLIVSGIPMDDEHRVEGVKRWCESFGEVNCITRIPNGDIHVDFRRAEVADTVCRLQARVYITGVGSVGLSWFTGKKP